jgi:hypothetical protein
MCAAGLVSTIGFSGSTPPGAHTNRTTASASASRAYRR